MSSKDSALFEVRKHNFSVLLSDDEEVDTKASGSIEASTERKGASVGATSASTASEANDGFTIVCKPKKPSVPKPRPGSTSSSSVQGSSSSASGFKPFPKELIIPKPETSLEFYEFPSTLRTGDLRKLLQTYEGHYRLKWNHDTSCFVVFDDSSLVDAALNQLSTNEEQVKVRRYEETVAVEAAPEVEQN